MARALATAVTRRRYIVEPPPLDLETMSLNETLAALGFRTRPDETALIPGRKEILGDGDEVLFVGRAGEVWTWLRERGLLEDRP